MELFFLLKLPLHIVGLIKSNELKWDKISSFIGYASAIGIQKESIDTQWNSGYQ